VLLLRPDPPVECLLCRRLPPREDPAREESPDDEKRRLSANPRSRWKSGCFFIELGDVGEWEVDDAVWREALVSGVCCAAGMRMSLHRREAAAARHSR
jgi:hypothetical protein